MDKENKINNSAELLGDIANASTTTFLSKIIDPYMSGIIGASIGKGLEIVTKDILNRILSKKETSRIETVASMSLKKIEDKLNSGQQIRNDDFFNGEEKSSASEVFEGTLLVAKSTYEEKKLELLSNLFSNISFDKSISATIANQLIKLADDLTYRQLIIIRCVGLGQVIDGFGIKTRKQTAYTQVSDLENVSIAIDTYDLYRRGCLSSKTVIFDPAGINPSNLSVTGYGALLWKLMDFEHRSADELEIDILNFMNINPVIDNREKKAT